LTWREEKTPWITAHVFFTKWANGLGVSDSQPLLLDKEEQRPKQMQVPFCLWVFHASAPVQIISLSLPPVCPQRLRRLNTPVLLCPSRSDKDKSGGSGIATSWITSATAHSASQPRLKRRCFENGSSGNDRQPRLDLQLVLNLRTRKSAHYRDPLLFATPKRLPLQHSSVKRSSRI
jgi:hypothetical protein